MVQRWTRSFPALKISRLLMNFVQALVQLTTSLIGKCFQNYILVQFGLVAVFACVKFSVTAMQRTNMLKVVIESMAPIYGFGIAIEFRRLNREIFHSVETLRNGLSNYSSCLDKPDEKKKLSLNNIHKTTIIAEIVIVFSVVKGIYDFAIVPLISIRQEFDNTSTKSIIAHVTGLLPNDTVFLIYFLGYILFFTPNLVLVGIFHIVWQIVLVNSIACLEGEFKILSNSLENVHQRAKDMFDRLKVDMMISHWSEWIRPTGRTRRRRRPSANMWSEEDELKLKEQCLFECLRESVRHHQSIYRYCIELNECLRMCMCLFGQILVSLVGVTSFMFVQEECKVTFECMKVFLLLIPSLISQGALCYFGQKLENNTEQIWFVLHGGDWLFKSERISQTVGLMLDQAVEPVILNAFTYNVNLSGFLQFIKATFAIVLLLTTSNAVTKYKAYFKEDHQN